MSLIQNLVPLGIILSRHYPGSLGQKVYPTVFLVELGHIGVITDTGEDSKLVHRRIWPKYPRYFLLFFSNGSERRVWPSRKYTGQFVPFSPVSVKDNFYDLIIEEMFAQFVIQTLRTTFYQEEILKSKFLVMLNLGLGRITVSNVRQVLIMLSQEIYFALPVTLDFIARILECLERV